MKKQELIHLHGLLEEVTEFCTAQSGTAIDREHYQSLGTRPTSIHRSKGDHKDAVFALTGALIEELDGESVEAETETVSAGAD
jgi:hypothetical protein